LQLDGRGGFDQFLEGEDVTGFGNWCTRKFAKRAVIGTLDADQTEMEEFASVSKGSWPGSTFVRPFLSLNCNCTNESHCCTKNLLV